VIPMGDLATHLAPLKSFEEFSQDLRVGDDALTPRESKKIPEMADKFEKEQPAAKEGAEPEPGRKVFDDVYDQLTKAGQDPNVARHDAALWAAFATSRGERLGVDPFEYYKQRSVNIGAEFAKDGSMVLGQPLSDFMGMNKEQFLGRPRITRASNAADLKPSEGKSLEGVPKEDFLGGKFKAKFSDKGAAVYDGDKVIASYSYLGGNTLVVDKKYRKQGIGQELVYQARTRYPDMPIAETRTIASQQLQEKVWRRIQKELARSIRYEQLSSDQFKKWFDGSQVVDKNGVPKVVYHGTSSGGFEYFDPKRADKRALKGPGFYFTENPEISSGYTEKAGGEAPAIYPVHLAIKNAFKEDSTAAELLPKLKKFKAEPPPPEIKRMIDASFKEDPSIASPESAGMWADNTEWAYKILDKMGTNGEEAFRPYFDYFIEHAVKFLEKEVKDGHIPKDEGFGAEVLGHIERNVFESSDASEGAANIRQVLEKLGFDGITHVGGNIVGDGTLKHRVWIAFEPTQIKGLFNKGTFDPKNPNILEQTLPKTETPEFKKWFGDSKIVDKEGNPLVVYHGTTARVRSIRRTRTSWSSAAGWRDLLKATGGRSASMMHDRTSISRSQGRRTSPPSSTSRATPSSSSCARTRRAVTRSPPKTSASSWSGWGSSPVNSRPRSSSNNSRAGSKAISWRGRLQRRACAGSSVPSARGSSKSTRG
jgi:GNAT superfamily N-acetyltransferase